MSIVGPAVGASRWARAALCTQQRLTRAPRRHQHHNCNDPLRIRDCGHSGERGAGRLGKVDPTPAFDGVDRIAYWTDIEGNHNYFSTLVDRSRAIYRRADGGLGLRDGCGFVYGGDTFDKGPGDIRISRALCDLKDRHPSRVVLLIGNRDVNKMRLVSELDPTALAAPEEAIEAPYYMRGLGRSAVQFYADKGWAWDTATAATATTAQDDTAIGHPAAPSTAGGVATSRNVLRLKWILEHTMNSPDAFEFRRYELGLLRSDHSDPAHSVLPARPTHPSPDSDAGTGAAADAGTAAAAAATAASVTDAEVFESFRAGVATGGCYRSYLERAQLAAVVGNTLFVHGAVTPASMGFVPAATTVNEPHVVAGTEHPDVAGWVEGLERYAQTALAAWEAAPRWDPGRRRRGGEALMAFAHNAAMAGRTVMVTTFLSDGNLAAVDPAVVRYLNGSGIDRVVVGHKPWGDSPGVIRTPASLEVICADTSFSDTGASDNRGSAAFEVLIDGGRVRNRTTIHGTLANGDPLEFSLQALGGGDVSVGAGGQGGGVSHDGVASPLTDSSAAAIAAAATVGTQLEDGYWVKAIVREAPSDASSPTTFRKLCCKGEGYRVTYSIRN